MNTLTTHFMLVHLLETNHWNWQRFKLKSKEWTGSTTCSLYASVSGSFARAVLPHPLYEQGTMIRIAI